MLSTAHRYFLQVVRYGSVKNAAVSLHVAPSAVSRQIAKLEHQCGAALFERRPQGMVLTGAGELLASHARRMAIDTEQAMREIRNLHRAELTTIRIGSNEAVARNLLPAIVGGFRQDGPDAEFQVHVASPGVVAQKVRDGGLDVGLAFSLHPGGARVRHEIASPLRAIMAPHHPLAALSSITIGDLRPHPVGLTDSGFTARLLFDHFAEGEGQHIRLTYSSNSSSVIRALVEAGDAVTLAGELPLADALAAGTLVARPMALPAFEARYLQVLAGSGLPDTTERFVQRLARELDATAARMARQPR
ncbi:LysR family transcriptional regulator [Bordetella genomosp. 13]|uniref:LysR family transcriptional regulator n=1 Tax=Bordetella genomosp. 13 TaxID=463040 RepID=UPI00119D587F|nr:LysR family transcriptional regulator [Bordetella genomosp. 13]